MSTKSIPFKPIAANALVSAEDWISQPQGSATTAPKSETPTKRLTIDVPEDLHRRMKVRCASDGTQMSDVVRDMLLREFPAK